MEFLVFAYEWDEKSYVEAYPINGISRCEVIRNLPLDIECEFREFPSRNQARKYAYIKWVNPNGIGFNKIGYRPYKN